MNTEGDFFSNSRILGNFVKEEVLDGPYRMSEKFLNGEMLGRQICRTLPNPENRKGIT